MGDGGARMTGLLSVGLSANAGIGGTGGGALANVGLAGGERYGMAKESERRCVGRKLGERGGGDGAGSERGVVGSRTGLSELFEGVFDNAERAFWLKLSQERAVRRSPWLGRRWRRGGGPRGVYAISGDGKRGGGVCGRYEEDIGH
jgi:hypothetical protein